MTSQLTPSEQLTHSTVRIECETAEGMSTGTGFFFNTLDDGKRRVPVIITNKHVISGARRGWFHLTKRKSDGAPDVGKHLRIEVPDFEKRWLLHRDTRVDLAAMPVGPLLHETSAAGHQFFMINLDKSLIPSATELAELSALEDVIMIGYPNGIWDSVNNLPVIRRGVTATHPNLDYEGRREFMIDAACFPGSSGSPVFLYNVGSWADRSGNTIMGGTRVKLLGVLYAGPQHTATGEIRIVNVPTKETPVSISRIPNNLGLIIKASRLLEFDDDVRPLVPA
jgi:V8-like Glu-specific endopeptidase